MAWSLSLPAHLKQHWKVKIYDKERLEPPHVTVSNRTRKWRIDLRSGQIQVPPGGVWSELPEDLVRLICNDWSTICSTWNNMYPHDPVATTTPPRCP